MRYRHGSKPQAKNRHSGSQRHQGSAGEPRGQRRISGHHAVTEFLMIAENIRSQSPTTLWIQEGWERSQDLSQLASLAERAQKRGFLEIKEQSKSNLDKVFPNHQGTIVFTDYVPEFDLEKIAAKDRVTLLFLDGLEDPHNLGAILRTAWLTGVSGVIATVNRSVGLTPSVHKVASGGVEHVPVLFQSQVGSLFDILKNRGFWIFGLSHKGSQSLLNWQAQDKVVWCLGSEDSGLRVSTERICDELLQIPQAAAGASYNVGAAAAMTLAIQMAKTPLAK